MDSISISIDELRDEQKRIAEEVGLEVYLKLTRAFGGTHIYIAKTDEIIKRKSRDEQIREEFNGYNYSELATKYGLSDVWIRNIVSGIVKEVRNKPLSGQMNLFDYENNDN